MELLEYFKNKWNLVLGVSLAIVVAVTDFLIPPEFSVGMAIARSNFSSLAKFVVAGLLLIILVPCSIFNKRKHTWYWWALAIILFSVAFIVFFRYQSLLDNKTAYDEYNEQQVIIGDHLTSFALRAVDSVKKTDGVDQLSPSEMLATLGPPTSIWPKQEIEFNARKLVINYLFSLSLFSLFVLFAIQATYCTVSQKNT
jgi:hypothetical protein